MTVDSQIIEAEIVSPFADDFDPEIPEMTDEEISEGYRRLTKLYLRARRLSQL